MRKTIERIKAVEHLNEMVKIFKGKVDLGLNRKVAEFECELNEVEAFLASNEERNSEYFLTRYLAWYLQFEVATLNGQKFLSIYLFPKSYYALAGNWVLTAVLEVSLLDQKASSHRTVKNTFEFGKGHMGSGWKDFVSIDFLRSGGFVKNNKIKVQLRLELGELATLPN